MLALWSLWNGALKKALCMYMYMDVHFFSPHRSWRHYRLRAKDIIITNFVWQLLQGIGHYYTVNTFSDLHVFFFFFFFFFFFNFQIFLRACIGFLFIISCDIIFSDFTLLFLFVYKKMYIVNMVLWSFQLSGVISLTAKYFNVLNCHSKYEMC